MKQLNNYSESEVLKIIDDVVGIIAPNFAFGYFDVDDIAQEARILAMDIINEGKYDEKRPLRNFLFVYLKSRLINLRRDKYFRHTLPCTTCPLYDPKCLKSTNACAGFADKMECERYNLWYSLNSAKKNLIDPIDIDSVNSDNESEMIEQGYLLEGQVSSELAEYIDTKLPLSFRADYLKMLSNYGVRFSQRTKLNTKRIKEIQGVVKNIVEEFNASRTKTG